jgi:hypothetical protein
VAPVDKLNLISRYNGLLEGDEALHKDSFECLEREMDGAGVRFGKDIVPTFLRPYFISEDEGRLLKYAVNVIMRCAEKLLKLYVADTQVADYLELTPGEGDLFAIPHGYEETAIICRLDGFLDEKGLRFLELNCDTPAGMGYGDRMAGLFLDLPVFQRMGDEYRYHYIETRERLLQVLLTCYRRYGGRDRPTIAMVGWEGLRTRPEFYLIKQTFEARGYQTVICDPRALEYSRGHLTWQGTRIHLIYRKVLTSQFIGRIDELQDILRAYREGAVCMANPFGSKLLSYKAILYFLTDPRFSGNFSEEEQEVLRRFIPWTRRIAQERVWYEGRQEDLVPFIRKEKDRFVIKPSDAFGGKGVCIGRETEPSRWDEVIQEALEGRWVVQEAIDTPEAPFPYFRPDVGFGRKKVNLNPFAFGSRYAGSVARISTSSIINVSAGGGILPVIQASEA